MPLKCEMVPKNQAVLKAVTLWVIRASCGPPRSLNFWIKEGNKKQHYEVN